MTRWQRIVMREAGLFAVLFVIAVILIHIFGGDIATFWKLIGCAAVAAIGAWLTVWWTRL